MIRFVISEIIAPVDCAQRLSAHQNNPRIGEVVAALRQNDGGPTKVWKLLDKLAISRRPPDRSARRFWRVMYAGHLRDALKAGAIFRWGRKMVGLNRPPATPRKHAHETGRQACALKALKG